jgi:RNA recognition motif-containing protein
LRAIFESFGMIDVITLKTASAMVTYEEEDDSVAAIANMNGFEFFGKCLKVSKAGN